MAALASIGLSSSEQAFTAEAPAAADAALFDRLDTDGNGQVAASEVASGHQRLFARLRRRADVNSDPSLSRDEFAAALVPSRPEKPIEEKLPTTFPQAEAVRWLLLTMDTNGSSWIEAEEVPEPFQEPLERLLGMADRDGDGQLSQREFLAGARRTAKRQARQAAAETPGPGAMPAEATPPEPIPAEEP